MTLSLYTTLALTVTFCVVLQEGYGLPLSEQSETPAESSSRHVRTKRCSCNNWLDKECIYFCHLDIIWVNTPSKIAPYGLGSPLSRRRRSVGRCECAHLGDKTCSAFCHNSSENTSIVVASPLEETDVQSDTSNKNLLTFLRNVVKANTNAVGQLGSFRKKHSRLQIR